MKGRALFATLFAMAALIAAFCLSIAYLAFTYLGNARAEMIAFALILALVVSFAASLIARAYRKAAGVGEARKTA
ncbi:MULTISPECIES: hypothetical protein [Sphingosinicellaceae]|uniref:hypothetical protein n=1 Tax=Sphingosinicellaceae TaxID=2820280 RepID=UPI001C1E1EBD|nr:MULTISPECIES: hypothetical protein [Polymorphobacter]QYE34013.1 hypothetical protein KZX46_14485 [Polymorphobacter sp. PAMC 29334]UAJ09180.1 hypothetical protein KTC28_12630 [Polymorphobacter megasporae]